MEAYHPAMIVEVIEIVLGLAAAVLTFTGLIYLMRAVAQEDQMQRNRLLKRLHMVLWLAVICGAVFALDVLNLLRGP